MCNISGNHIGCNTRRQLAESDDYLFCNHVCFGGKMCCWHSLWLRCVSSEAVCHSLVTQRELLISQERDVLASVLGSFEDKQLVRAAKATYVEKF